MELLQKYRVRGAFFLVACTVVIVMSACNTTKGVGQDMQSAGKGIQDSAEKHGAN